MASFVIIVSLLLLSCAGGKKSPAPAGKEGTASGSGVAELQRQLKELESKEQNSRTALASLINQLNDLENNPGQVPNQSIEELQKKIDELTSADNSQEIAKLKKKLESVEAGDADAIAELHKEFTALNEKYNALLESTSNTASSPSLTDDTAQQPSELPTEPPTISALLTHAGEKFFEDGLIKIIIFSNMAGVTEVEQQTDLNSGGVNKMPTTTIRFKFNNTKYCASINNLTSDNFISFKNLSPEKVATIKKDTEVTKCE